MNLTSYPQMTGMFPDQQGCGSRKTFGEITFTMGVYSKNGTLLYEDTAVNSV